MPRLKKTAVQLHADELARKDGTLLGIIEMNRVILGLSTAQLAEAIGMPYSTLCYRKNHPREFRRGEIMALFEVLRVPDSDKAEVQW